MVKEKHKAEKHEKPSESVHEPQQAQPAKRLYRAKKNQMIAGVCSGLGEYFSIDPAIIRLIFILATIFGGYGVIVYIILWIILPEESNDKVGSEETVKKNIASMRDKANDFASEMKTDSNSGRMRIIIGAVLIGLGLMFFLDNFGIFRADIFWPLVLVAIGVLILRR
jgi:phage shock protein C